jgi:hypothetical protein
MPFHLYSIHSFLHFTSRLHIYLACVSSNFDLSYVYEMTTGMTSRLGFEIDEITKGISLFMDMSSTIEK